MQDMSKYAELTETQQLRITRSHAVTERQLNLALQLARSINSGDNAVLIGSILQALATNYLATVQAAKD